MILDVSLWEKDTKKQASGTRAKFWIKHPKFQTRYLFKIPRENTGEYWAEFIASKIGQAIGMEIIDVELATYNGTIGTIAKNFVKTKEEFYEGGDLFFTLFSDFDRYALKHYNFSNIIKVLTPYNLERAFISVPVFDAFIGNQDRHCDNWGIIMSDDAYKLSPIYDNGTSMGFNLQAKRIRELLMDYNRLQNYCNKGISLIGLNDKHKPRCLELLEEVNAKFPVETKKVLEQIGEVNRQMILKILDDIPPSIMDDVYKEWVEKLLIYRKEWLFKWYKGKV